MLTATLESLAQAAGGKLMAGRPETVIHGIFTDTRTPVAGSLFVALRGENFDGNLFAREAVEKGGAAAVLVDNVEVLAQAPSLQKPEGRLPAPPGVILVEDSREGYLGIAARHRRQLAAASWFGVTGSVGKSSTKEMLAHILAQAAGWKVHKAKASFNNAVGLAHTILAADTEHQAAVLELGSNHPGEIRVLAAVARPDIAIITCAAEAHLEAFGSVGHIACEKGQILFYQNKANTAVLNADDPHFSYWRALAPGKVITFGQGEGADVRGKHLRMNAYGCADFLVRHGDMVAECSLRLLGAHQTMNALAAVAAAVAAGVPLESAVRALCSFEGVSRRLALKEVRGFTLIDDAYNANPASFAAALETLKKFRAQRKFLVAGDMLELGADAPLYHRHLGRLIADCGLTSVVTVGSLASLAGAAAVEDVQAPLNWVACATPQEAAKALKPALRPGDVVLLKASHGMHLEKCVELLSA